MSEPVDVVVVRVTCPDCDSFIGKTDVQSRYFEANCRKCGHAVLRLIEADGRMVLTIERRHTARYDAHNAG